jgi:hypothetical protein
MWLTIFTNYRSILAGLMLAFVAILITRVQVVTAQRDLAIQNLDTYKIQATILRDQAKEQSDKSLEDAKRDYAIQTKKAADNAWANAKVRFGAACTLGSIRLPTLPSSNGGGEARIPEGTVPTPVEESVVVGRDFIEACAADVVWINTVKAWCHNNALKGCE